MTTEKTVAQWLVEKVRAEGTLHQEEAVHLIEHEFGRHWVYEDVNHNQAINQTALKQFRQIHGGAIQWDNTERAWTVA
jgi:hypothetical protein